MPWDPAQYLKFAGPRLRPAIDLIARIEAAAPRRVYDLGAGAGNVTRLLAERWPQAEIVGVDGSPEMLARAAAELPHLAWEQADLAAWRPRRAPDLIYSNAALHWIEGHRELIVALFAALAPGGTLAIQMPRNFAAPSPRSMGEAARMGPWRSVLAPLLRPAPVSEPEVYYDLLAGRARRLDIWESEYLQVLDGEHPVKEFTKSTWLAPLLDALDEPWKSQFEACYTELVDRAYPRRADGKTLFPFRRLFIVATAG